MWRLFIAIGLGSALLVTSACNSGKKHRISLKKVKEGSKSQVSPRTQAINKAIEDKECLRIDILITEFMKQTDETVLIYTYNLDMGSLTSMPNKNDMVFQSQIDPKTRAHAFLKNPEEPILEVVSAQDLQSKTKAAYLLSPVAMDDKCETVAYENGLKTNFNVIKKGGNTLWLQNKADTSEFIRYVYNRKDKLFISHYTPNLNQVCGKQPRTLMRSYVVAREEGLDNIEIDRDFAKLIADNIDEPLELKAVLNKEGRTAAKVSLSQASLELVHQTLRDEKFKQPACP